jgi:hypothetical protein
MSHTRGTTWIDCTIIVAMSLFQLVSDILSGYITFIGGTMRSSRFFTVKKSLLRKLKGRADSLYLASNDPRYRDFRLLVSTERCTCVFREGVSTAERHHFVDTAPAKDIRRRVAGLLSTYRRSRQRNSLAKAELLWPNTCAQHPCARQQVRKTLNAAIKQSMRLVAYARGPEPRQGLRACGVRW